MPLRTFLPLLSAVLWLGVSGVSAQEANGPPKSRLDYLGDPLPDGAVLRLGTERFRHPGPIGSLLFSRDGKILISTGDDGKPVAWEVQTGKRIPNDKVPPHLLLNPDVESPDDKHFVAFKNDREELQLHDKATGKLRFSWKNEDVWLSAAFSRDGKTLLALGRDNQVTAWNVADGKRIRKQGFGLVPWARFADRNPTPILSPDGSVVAGVLKEDWPERFGPVRVRFFDPVTGRENHKPVTLPKWWRTWNLSADGKRLTVYYEDSAIDMWDIATGERTVLATKQFYGGGLHLPGKKQAVIAISPNVLLADFETEKILWETEVAPPVMSGSTMKLNCVGQLARSRDGKTIAAGTDNGHIELLNLADGSRVGGSRLHPGFFRGPFHPTPDGKTMLVTLGDKPVHWDLASGKTIRELDAHVDEELASLSLDGKQYAHYRPGGKDVRKLCLMDLATGKDLWEREDNYRSLRFSPDGATLAVFDWDFERPEARFLSSATGRLERTFDPKTVNPKTGARVSAGRVFALSADLKTAAVESAKKNEVQLWDTVTGKQLWTWENPDDGEARFREAHILPDRKGAVIEMDLTRAGLKTHLYQLDGAGKLVRSINGREIRAVSPDMRHMAYELHTDEGQLLFEVRNLVSGEVVLREKWRDSPTGRWHARHAAFSADGNVFGCTLDGESVEFFDLRTKKRLGPPRPHPAYVRGLKFMPRGHVMAAGYNDSNIILWDADLP
ncbi:WD40 repeat domain-containing protein [Zavarzinella formosa]|uniref:WD40 repeat domain-containing protein n=1 Tax=Zavarzinella formosa TaxID=360055 RepID=UPI00030D0797|nr:WD40 repeat domain-containing protein [Zavarzinella formosa]